MSTSLDNRFLRLRSLCRRAYASDAPYIIGGTIALLAPRFVGAGAFSTMSFGSTSIILEFACLIATLLSFQIPQKCQAHGEDGGTASHAGSRPLAMIPLLFLCICASFILFECAAFAIAINGGYDPSGSWVDSPAHHIEQMLSAAALISFCLLIFSRSHHASSDRGIQTSGTQDLRAAAFCMAALFLAGACLAGLPLLSSYAPFGSLSKSTASCLFASTASLIIALLASSLLLRCAASSKAAYHLSFFFCGSIVINLGRHDALALTPQSFNPPFCLAVLATAISILALFTCLQPTCVKVGSCPDSDITPTPSGPLFEAPFDRLSDRERQVLLLSAQGHTVHSIAQELGIATTTISTYKSRMSRKLQLNWQEILDQCGIWADDNDPKTRKLDGCHALQHKTVDHPFISSAISLSAGVSFTLLLNNPRPAPIFAELLCIVGVLFFLVFNFLKEDARQPFSGGDELVRYLLLGAVSSLSACAISHITDGKTAPLSPNQHLLLFLLAWCTITALNHFWKKTTSQAAKARALDKNRARSYLNSKGIQGMYLEVAIATLNGTPASEIARNLCISTSTVTSYRARIYAKLHVCGREGLFQLLRAELV